MELLSLLIQELLLALLLQTRTARRFISLLQTFSAVEQELLLIVSTLLVSAQNFSALIADRLRFLVINQVLFLYHRDGQTRIGIT